MSPHVIASKDLSRYSLLRQPVLRSICCSSNRSCSSLISSSQPAIRPRRKLFSAMLQRHRPYSSSGKTGSSSRTAGHPGSSIWSKQLQRRVHAAGVKTPYPEKTRQINTDAPTDVVYDAVIVGGGYVAGGVTNAAAQHHALCGCRGGTVGYQLRWCSSMRLLQGRAAIVAPLLLLSCRRHGRADHCRQAGGEGCACGGA